MDLYDVIIIGAGPGGLNAAVYAARYRLKVLVIGEIVGGMAAEAYEVCNFLTYDKIRGYELALKMREQVKKLGVGIMQKKVTEIVKTKKGFEVRTNDEAFHAKKIIIATGTHKRELNLLKEKKLVGRGVSYCATCDAAFFKDKDVAVAGGSDAALTAALLLSLYAKIVYIVYRKGSFLRAEPAWVHLVNENKKIKPIFDSNIVELIGESKLEGILLDSKKELKVDGLFVEIGAIPQSRLAKDMGVKLDDDYIMTDEEQRTNVDGVFACGDVTDNLLKQIIVAAAEGAIAAKMAYNDIMAEIEKSL
ncbi:MAG: NAD(P)/FAD-dependent oxidoreductase [archaeon]